MARALICDSFHIHAKNYGSLFEYMKKNAVNVTRLTKGEHLWNRYAVYHDVKRVARMAKLLDTRDQDELLSMTVQCCGTKINLFDVSIAEILTLVLAQNPSWYDQCVPNDPEWLMRKLYTENKNILVHNLAAAVVWCEIYDEELIDANKYEFAVVFSGSQIYQKIFTRIMAAKTPRLFILESFTTGSDFYWEERYTPIANQCSIQHDNVYKKYEMPNDFAARQVETTKAINKFLEGRNKNVLQPEKGGGVADWGAGEETVLIAAQVQNDFSVIESGCANLNLLQAYKELIDLLVEQTSCNVVVKCHPFERRKINLNRPFIKEELDRHLESLSAEQRSRIHVIEDFNIAHLLKSVDYFVTFNSQSSFEACLYGGLKPIVMGKPFYRGRGFTSEYEDIRALVDDIAQGAVRSRLTIEEYEFFLCFITKLLQFHLCSHFPSGTKKIAAELAKPRHVSLLSRKAPVKGAGQKKVALPAKSVAAPASLEGGSDVSLSYDELYSQACRAYNNGDSLVALELFRKAETMNESNANLKRCIAEAYVNLNMKATALVKLKEAQAMIPNNRNLRRRIRSLEHPLWGVVYFRSKFDVPKH